MYRLPAACWRTMVVTVAFALPGRLRFPIGCLTSFLAIAPLYSYADISGFTTDGFCNVYILASTVARSFSASPSSVKLFLDICDF
jgi:hypothetical protein